MKLFSSILDSSIWDESDVVIRVWITMLAMCDQHGTVSASTGGIAHRARKTKEETRKALDILMSPDPDSRSPEHDGRRVARVPGGFAILNYAKYRAVRAPEERRLQNLEAQRRYREKGKQCKQAADSKPESAEISQRQPKSAQAEAEAEGEGEEENESAGESRGGARRKRRTARAPFRAPTDEEWARYSAEMHPDWPRDDVLSALGHYQTIAWRDVRDWHGCVRTCYHRWAANGNAGKGGNGRRPRPGGFNADVGKNDWQPSSPEDEAAIAAARRASR